MRDKWFYLVVNNPVKVIIISLVLIMCAGYGASKLVFKVDYRVFFGEFPTVSRGNDIIRQLPASVRTNSPYLHSIYRMQQALL